MLASGQTVMTAAAIRVGVDEGDHGPGSELYLSVTGSGAVFVGPAGVSAATGLSVPIAGPPLKVPLQLGDAVYAIGPATATVTWLQSGI